jgi:hypothetical protein
MSRPVTSSISNAPLSRRYRLTRASSKRPGVVWPSSRTSCRR